MKNTGETAAGGATVRLACGAEGAYTRNSQAKGPYFDETLESCEAQHRRSNPKGLAERDEG